MTSEDRRESFRMMDLSRAACYLINDTDRHEGTLRNLSVDGFFLETTAKPDLMQTYEIEIVLEGTHSRLIVDNLSGVVTRNEKDGSAVEFSEKFEWLVLAPIFYHTNSVA